MQMSDSGALWGALLLSEQLEMDRRYDHRRRMRGIDQLQTDYAVLRQRFIDLVAQYDQLAANHNQLRAEFNEVHDRALALADEGNRNVQQIDQLLKEKAEREAEREIMQVDLKSALLDVKLLRNIIKQHDPDYSLYE
jgi:chromosome segregation ATPase